MTSHRWRAQWASILGASERRLASPRSWQKDELSKHRRNEAESAGEMVGGGCPCCPGRGRHTADGGGNAGPLTEPPHHAQRQMRRTEDRS